MPGTRHHPLAWIQDELAALDDQQLRRYPFSHPGGQGATIQVDGRELVNFGSNDYLGLAADPRVIAAAQTVAAEQGWGAGASPLVTGRSSAHERLEQQLAGFEDTEAALLFSSGYTANVGTIAALAGRGDAIFADAKNHASLIDGCRLTRAEVFVYPHCDARKLGELLASTTNVRRRLIVTDTLFSMDGDAAPLVDIAELAQSYDCMLLVDEAHATGVFGAQGRGLCEQLGVEADSVIRVGTLSKALGSAGGFVVGQQSLIEWLRNRARTYVFSTASPPAVAAAASEALRIMQEEPWRREQLLERAAWLRAELNRAGLRTGNSTSQIIPILVGDAGETIRLATRLRESGLFVPGIRPPSVPDGESLLRISLSYLHTQEMLERLLSSLLSS